MSISFLVKEGEKKIKGIPSYHSASSIHILDGFSTIAKPFTTTKRTRFSSCITNSGNLDLVSKEVANSRLLNIQGPVYQSKPN